MIRISEVKIGDWETLREMLDDLVHEDPPVALELEPLIMKGREWIAQFPRGNLGYFVVARDKRKIIGFCYVAVPTYYQPIAFIGIAVAKKYRQDNIGAQMFYEVAQWAAGKEVQYIIADIWEWNELSHAFFEHLGFTEKSRFTDKFRGEEKQKIRMVRKI